MSQEQIFTAEDREGLINDLNAFNMLLQAHDQSIFQLIASINATQKLLIDNGVISKEVLIQAVKEEGDRIVAKFSEAQAQEQAQAQAEASQE